MESTWASPWLAFICKEIYIYIYIYKISEEMEEYNRFFWGGGNVETPHGFRSALNFE